MTLQSSGPMTIADINTEMGRASGAQLSTDDTELLGMANLTSSDPITIPDDLYGKTYIGALYGTFNITVGTNSSLYGFESSNGTSPTGSIDTANYRGSELRWFYSRTGSISFDVTVVGSHPSDFVTGVRFITDGGLEYFSTNITSHYVLGGITGWNFSDGSDGPWGASDSGLVKQVEIYGAP